MIYKKNNNLSLEISKAIIYCGETISDALKNLSISGYKICIVLDRKNNFKGVLNDGDIRRALLKGKNLSSKIDNIYNKKPIVFRKNLSRRDILKKLVSEKIDQAPFIEKKKVIGIYPYNKPESKVSDIKTIIMCGGFGKRLKPITLKIPKALVMVNKVPILSRIINNLKNNGFKEFIFSTYYKSNLIKKYYKNGKSHGVKIKYITEKKPLGTAGSLSLLRNRIKEKHFLVTNCDVVSEINYRSLLQFHKDNNADLTVAIKKFSSESQFGEINVKGIYINDIKEKPKRDMIINAAIYVFKTKIIKEINYNKYLDMNELIIKLIKKKKKIIAFPFYDNWFDLGTKKELINFKTCN